MNNREEVLIINYNLEKNFHEFDRREVLYLSIDKILQVLREMSFDSTNPVENIYPSMLLTKDFLIRKMGENSFKYKYNKIWETSRKFKRAPTTLDKIEELLRGKRKSYFLSLTIYVIFSSLLWLLFPFLNILNLINRINSSFYTLNIVLIFILLLIISSLTIVFIVKNLVQYISSPQKIEIGYSLPFLDSFSQIDISEYVFVLGQFIYGIFYISLDFFIPTDFSTLYYSTNLLLLILGLCFGVPIIIITINDYRIHNTRKKYCLQLLYKKLHSNIDDLPKLYYLELSAQVKKKKIIGISLIAKISTSLSFLMSIIPPIIEFF